MTPQKLFEVFKKITGFSDTDVERYFVLGKEAIRVRFKDKNEYIFKYRSPRKWRLETYESYLYGFDNGRKK